MVNITGDGAFGFTLKELDTARRYRLPVVTVIHNNAAWGIIRAGPEQAARFRVRHRPGRHRLRRDRARLRLPRRTGVGRSRRWRRRSNVALASGLPAVIDCRTRFVPHPAMAAFGSMNRYGSTPPRTVDDVADLILGPMLRDVGPTWATIWFEADAPCTVKVLGHSARTFTVAGHYYALVIVEGLEPGSTTEYDVHVDGERRWPSAGSRFPPSVIRTVDAGQVRVLFGSCRTAAPHEPPWTLEMQLDPTGRGVDALRAHALRMLGQPHEEWPHLAVMLGDQVYADDSSPATHERIKSRRENDPVEGLPPELVGGFEEFCWLYHESWSPDVERWFFSVVPTAMIFDDHDMVDDWNISDSWVREVRQEPWWDDHVIGGLVSYWIYQHLGNLSPAEIRTEGMLAELGELDDGAEYLREWARASEEFTPVPGGYRFSFAAPPW